METSSGVRECVYAFEEAAKVSPNVCVHMREWVGFASLRVYKKGASYCSTSHIPLLKNGGQFVCMHTYVFAMLVPLVSMKHFLLSAETGWALMPACVCVCALKRGTLHSEQVFPAAVGLWLHWEMHPCCFSIRWLIWSPESSEGGFLLNARLEFSHERITSVSQ